MENGIISHRYAGALFLFAKSRGKLVELYDESLVLGERLKQTPKLMEIISDRMVDPGKKAELIEAFTGSTVSAEFSDFIRLVIRQKREEHLRTILLSFQEMVQEELRWVDVYLTTAIDADDDLKEHITRDLSEKMNATVFLHTETDPSIIGGYILRWDTYSLDVSVRGRLNRIREELTAKK